VDRPKARVTYITPEQETALLEVASPAFAIALKVCIRTGARPGCEFAALTSKHVRFDADKGRMEWVFSPEESKTKKLRSIRVTDPEIIQLVNDGIARWSHGPIFRNASGTAWTRENLALNFRRAKQRSGVPFDSDACMYSTRHTYAKRTLQGFWTGKSTNIETLARLMGNSPQVCRDHYLQWTETYNEPLWESA
jgi:integrase